MNVFTHGGDQKLQFPSQSGHSSWQRKSRIHLPTKKMGFSTIPVRIPGPIHRCRSIERSFVGEWTDNIRATQRKQAVFFPDQQLHPRKTVD